jgi:hypothetical protein
MAARARQRALTFTPARMAAGYVAAYKQLVAEQTLRAGHG